jgi:hypothetical protein
MPTLTEGELQNGNPHAIIYVCAQKMFAFNTLTGLTRMS